MINSIKRIGNKIPTLYRCNVFRLSALKTKLQKLQSSEHKDITELYHSMLELENGLDYEQKLKYQKFSQPLKKKIIKLQNQSPSPYSFTTLPFPLTPSISYNILYSQQNKQYQPINGNLINSISLQNLYMLTAHPTARFRTDFDIVWAALLANPAANQNLYKELQARCGMLEEQITLGVFQEYARIIREAEEARLLEKGAKDKLKSFKGINQIKYSKDFKFNLKQQLTRQQHDQTSSIAKTITKYGFSSQKIMMFSIKVLAKDSLAYKALTPHSLQNHLFILGYYKHSLPDINDNIFKILDILSSAPTKSKEIEGEIGPMNSLLFYLLANKVENYQLFKVILAQLDHQFRSRSDPNGDAGVDGFDGELFCLMLELIKSKFDIATSVDYMKIASSLKKVNSNAHQDFQNFLIRKNYKFQKTESKIIGQQIYRIDDKNLINLNLARINKKTEKTNGVGDIILENFKAKGQQVKVINPVVLRKCQKRVQKEEYFKTKLKGIREPESIRERRFDF